MLTAECSLCGEMIELGLILKFGQRLHCPACKAYLEVVNLKPIKLDWLFYDEYVEEDDKYETKINKLVECPRCLYEFKNPSALKLGQLAFCPSCNAELEVAWLDPVVLWLNEDNLNWPLGEDFIQEEYFMGKP